MPANKDLSRIDEINQRFEPFVPVLMGVHVTALLPRRVMAELAARPDLCAAGGIQHGGAYMAFADTSGALATLINLPPGTRTVVLESKTHFMGGAPVGTLISGECTPFHRGKSTMVWQTVVRNTAGKTLAVVSQTRLVSSLARVAGDSRPLDRRERVNRFPKLCVCQPNTVSSSTS